MKALWAPLEVASLEASRDFYSRLGLPVVQRFDGGVVFGIGVDGRLEIVAPATGSPPPPVALEVSTWGSVDSAFARVGGDAPPSVFPRGHYGFVARDPDGNRLLIWSEE
jgi:catechol 2,3-dioxygenase-like lactoylglutathione lyase family enzyme